MWATRPEPRQHFWKIVGSKNFWLPAACLRETTCVQFGKAGAHPQLAWESQLPLKPCISLPPLDFKGNCDSLWFSLRFYLRILVQFDLLRKCGLLAHTSAAFLKNCCTEKLFICLRLVSYSLFLFHKHQKSGCSVSTGFQKLVEGTSALLFYFFRMLLLTLMQELLVNPQICI